MKSKILLLSDDEKTTASIISMLSAYDVFQAENASDFLLKAIDLKADLILLDFDLAEKDGLLVYRDLRQRLPFNKTIMFSSSNSIPLAVQAAKLGIMDFLRKPLDPALLLESISKVIKAQDTPKLNINDVENSEWLFGMSSELNKMLEQAKIVSRKENDLIILGERGIDKKTVAKLIHDCGRDCDKRFVALNLMSFGQEVSEPHFFLTLKEILSSSDTGNLREKKELTGTVFLSGVDTISEAFRLSIFQFIKDKKSPVRIILGVYNPKHAYDFEVLELPTLRSRREDIPIILSLYVKRFAPQIKYISPEAIELFMYYDFPGNYVELQNLIETAAISYPGAEVLNFKSLPIDIKLIKNVETNKTFSKEAFDLNEIRSQYDMDLLSIVLEKTNYDTHLASRFLDMPRTNLVERIKNLLG